MDFDTPNKITQDLPPTLGIRTYQLLHDLKGNHYIFIFTYRKKWLHNQKEENNSNLLIYK